MIQNECPNCSSKVVNMGVLTFGGKITFKCKKCGWEGEEIIGEKRPVFEEKGKEKVKKIWKD